MFGEDELHDLAFKEERGVPKERVKWLASARIHASNYFTTQTFEQHMMIGWSPTRELKLPALEDNLFTIHCFFLGDWNKDTEGGSWNFKKKVVIIEPYGGLVSPNLIALNQIFVWVQIHSMPNVYKHEALIKSLDGKNFFGVDKWRPNCKVFEFCSGQSL
jgi:hypothetical protein